MLALLMWVAMTYICSGWPLQLLTLLFIIVFTIDGTWATAHLQPFWGEDPKKVVVDEMVGMWIALLALPERDWIFAALAFLLFRAFDIFKPLGIRALDRKSGAFYVIADDMLAGFYTFIIILLAKWAI